MKVYILSGWIRHESKDILSVHATERSAKKQQKKEMERRVEGMCHYYDLYDGYDIEEYDVEE